MKAYGLDSVTPVTILVWVGLGWMISMAQLCFLLLTAALFLRLSEGAENISTVYLVSSCHLDVGFANTAANIVNEYFDKYFPEAIQIANELRETGGEERLVFTTHPFLVYLYLNCHPALGLHCPDGTKVNEFSDAVRRGDIVWHAFPFNAQMEFYDQSMANFGFQVTHMLDAHFQRAPTVTMSQRDVPGTTRSIIPILVKNGVKAITVGVNTASMPPAVPTAFVWKDPVSGEDIIGMWHPHGYGGQHGPSKQSMVIVPGMSQALAFAIRGDNSGPPPVLEVMENFAILKLLFPGAKIVASGYDVFVNELVKFKSQLPVYTEEIGDTWIHGVASDPWKTAASRVMMRLRADCLSGGACSLDDARFVSFSQMLIKNGEHTWGKDVKTFLHDTTHWTNPEFHSVINEPNFQDMVDSWVEQRFWGIDYAKQLLYDHPLRSIIEEYLQLMSFDGEISTEGYSMISNLSTVFKIGNIELAFSPDNGSIVHLADSRSSPPVVYADPSHLLGQLVYQTFTQEDYKKFIDEYVYDFSQGFIYLDLGKPGLNGTKKLTVSPKLKVLWYQNATNDFLLQLYFDDEVVTSYGGAQIVWIQVTVNWNDSPITIDFTVYFVLKTPTRIPESFSFHFHPEVRNTSTMAVSKLGEYINVLEVIKNGSKHLHASDQGISYSEGLNFTALDTSLVIIGSPNPFPVPMEQPDVSKGFSFNIYNNIWGTNYIMWYPYVSQDASSKYRFTMSLPSP